MVIMQARWRNVGCLNDRVIRAAAEQSISKRRRAWSGPWDLLELHAISHQLFMYDSRSFHPLSVRLLASLNPGFNE